MKRSVITLAASALLLMTMVAPTFADTASTASSPTKGMMMQSKKAKMTVDPACMSTAVTTRDTAISAALQGVVNAIQTRGQSLAMAWGNTDAKARMAAVKAANAAFKGSWMTFNTARKAAWTQFATTAKSCHAASSDVQAPSADAGAL